MRFATVIPAFNEAPTIRDIAARALQYCERVIVVDDGSTDGTDLRLDGLPVQVLRNPANLGKAASLWRGARAARADGVEVVITLDADGQHAPEDIPRLMAMALQHPGDIVIGARRMDRTLMPKLRYFGNRVAIFWLSWACGQRLDDSQSGFRAYPASLFDESIVKIDRQHGFVFESEILIEAARRGHHCVTVPIATVYRPDSRLSYFRQRDTLRIIRMIAWKLLSRGLYLQGLYRAYFSPGSRD